MFSKPFSAFIIYLSFIVWLLTEPHAQMKGFDLNFEPIAVRLNIFYSFTNYISVDQVYLESKLMTYFSALLLRPISYPVSS